MDPNDVREILNIEHPLICAPMGGVAGGELAAAVSAAGGLGMIGMGSTGSAGLLQKQLDRVPSGTRIGIGLVDWVARKNPDMLDLAIDTHPAVLSVSFGNTYAWVRRAKEAGIITATQVADAAEAQLAINADVDLIVARGLQGGGHGKPLRELTPLLADVLLMTTKPVLAAGAISSHDDVCELLAAGASGVWVGTAFTVATEALSTAAYRGAVLAAKATDTVLTTAFDQVAGYEWPRDVPERVIANAFTARWNDALASSHSSVSSNGRNGQTGLETAAEEFRRATATDDPSGMSINVGMGVGSITHEQPAADIIGRLMQSK